MKMRIGTLTGIAAGLLLTSATAHGAQLTVGTARGEAGATAEFAVTLQTQGNEVVGTENEISASRSVATFNVITVSTSLQTAIDADDTTIVVADSEDLPAFGVIQIQEELISYGRVNRSTNTLSQVTRAESGTTAAAHNSGVPVTVPTDVPDCQADPGLNKDAAFAFTPAGCDPGTDCTGVKAVVIRVDKDDPNALTPIPEGATLYSCTVTVQTDGVLGCDETRSSDADGNLNEPTTCVANAVVIGGAACAGDCDGNGSVSLGEVQTALDVFFETLPITACENADINASETVSLGEVQTGLDNFFNDCPQ